MHQTVGKVLRTLTCTKPPGTLNDAKQQIDKALATASHADRTNVSQVTGCSPGSLAFHRDVLLNIPLIIDLLQIRDRKQLTVDENLRRFNAKKRTCYWECNYRSQGRGSKRTKY